MVARRRRGFTVPSGWANLAASRRDQEADEMKLKDLCGAVALALAGVLAAGQAVAQGWPARPVTLVVPFPAGSGPDVLARHVSADMAEKFRQPFVVENRAGA